MRTIRDSKSAKRDLPSRKRTGDSLYNRVFAMPVSAVQHVRRMRGGAQSQLMRASDGYFYIVKFQNNPQHPRILANEILATRLADQIGLAGT